MKVFDNTRIPTTVILLVALLVSTFVTLWGLIAI